MFTRRPVAVESREAEDPAWVGVEVAGGREVLSEGKKGCQVSVKAAGSGGDHERGRGTGIFLSGKW